MKNPIYTSLITCQQRIDAADELLRQTWVDNVTQTLATPRKHPTKELWTFDIEERYEYLFTAEELDCEPLDETWFPKQEFPLI